MPPLLTNRTTNGSGSWVAIAEPGTLIVSGDFDAATYVVVEVRDPDATTVIATVGQFASPTPRVIDVVNVEARATVVNAGADTDISVSVTQP